jgi:hypothetical protein
MAKVSGPLMSMSASGKLADSIVFFGWKGINVVRQWLKPSNPKSTGQGNQRIMMGGVGRAVGEILVESRLNSKLQAKNVIPAGQTKQSYLVKYILDHYLSTATLYTAELAACTGHGAYTSFGARATAMGVVNFDLDYASVGAFDKALGLYLIAKSVIALGFTGAPYTDALSAWTKTDVDAFAADFKA